MLLVLLNEPSVIKRKRYLSKTDTLHLRPYAMRFFIKNICLINSLEWFFQEFLGKEMIEIKKES